MKKELRIAYHESGHALACYFVGVRFKIVTIIPTEGSMGSLIHHRISRKMASELNWYDNTKTQIWHTNHMVISLAGAEATRLVCGRSCGHYGDFCSVSEMAIMECGTGEASKAYIKFLHLLTRDFLKKDRKLLDKIAEELLEKKTLTYNQVKEIVEKERARDSALE